MVAEKPKMLPELMRVINFTDADLKANRAGQMTGRQIINLKNKGWETGLAGVTFTIIVLFLMYLRPLYPDAGCVMGLCLTLVIVNAVCISAFVHQAQDIHDLKVEKVSGTVSKNILTSRTTTTYQLKIQKSYFNVDKPLYDIFTEADYTLYFLPNTRTILSAEFMQDESLL
jgi:hypothetical protein